MVVQEDNALKVIKRQFSDPAKSRKAYAQHGLIRHADVTHMHFPLNRLLHACKDAKLQL